MEVGRQTWNRLCAQASQASPPGRRCDREESKEESYLKPGRPHLLASLAFPPLDPLLDGPLSLLSRGGLEVLLGVSEVLPREVAQSDHGFIDQPFAACR